MKVNKQWKQKSGIYKISCSKGDYIGSSVDLYNRLAQHISHLRAGTHHSKRMQRSYNKYGEETFSIEILRFCKKDIPTLRQKEEDYMKLYNSCHNSITPVTYEHSQETREKIANTMRIMWKNNPELNPRLGKGFKLWAYDFLGNSVAKNVTTEELAQILNLSNRHIFANALRKGRAVIDKQYVVLKDDDWGLLFSWIVKREGQDIPLYKLCLDGQVFRCSSSAKSKVLKKVLLSPGYCYYSSHKNCFYTFIGLIEKCRLREEIPQIITAELSKEGEIPNLN